MAMTVSRLISPATRSGFVLVAGTALMIVPVAAGMSVAAAVAGVAVGAIAVALGIAGTASDGRGSLPLAAQAAYDRGLALGLLIAAGLLGLGGDQAAMGLFAAAGLASLSVASVTRYSASTV